jgi:hypothetical protein
VAGGYLVEQRYLGWLFWPKIKGRACARPSIQPLDVAEDDELACCIHHVLRRPGQDTVAELDVDGVVEHDLATEVLVSQLDGLQVGQVLVLDGLLEVGDAVLLGVQLDGERAQATPRDLVNPTDVRGLGRDDGGADAVAAEGLPERVRVTGGDIVLGQRAVVVDENRLDAHVNPPRC